MIHNRGTCFGVRRQSEAATALWLTLFIEKERAWQRNARIPEREPFRSGFIRGRSYDLPCSMPAYTKKTEAGSPALRQTGLPGGRQEYPGLRSRTYAPAAINYWMCRTRKDNILGLALTRGKRVIKFTSCIRARLIRKNFSWHVEQKARAQLCQRILRVVRKLGVDHVHLFAVTGIGRKVPRSSQDEQEQ